MCLRESRVLFDSIGSAALSVIYMHSISSMALHYHSGYTAEIMQERGVMCVQLRDNCNLVVRGCNKSFDK